MCFFHSADYYAECLNFEFGSIRGSVIANSESELILTMIPLQNSCAKNFSRVTAVTLWQANNLLRSPSTKVS